jgi:hypothetical protein
LDASQGSGGDAGNLTIALHLIDSIQGVPVLALLMALRSGVTAKQTPFSAVVSDLGIQVLYALALLQNATEAAIQVQQVGDRAWVKLADRIVNFAHGREATTAVSLVRTIETDLRDAKARGLLAPETPIVAVASGFMGPLPTKSLPPDILGDPGTTNLIDGPDRLDVVWISLPELTNRTAVEARTMVLAALS